MVGFGRWRRFGATVAVIIGVTGLTIVARADWSDTRRVAVDTRLGVAWMTRSKSTALEHLFKPTLRVGGRARLGARLELGGAFTAVVDANEHYRALGFLTHARFAVIATRRFSLGMGLAFGIGTDADIMHSDLRARTDVAAYGFGALDARFLLSSRLFLCAEVAYENLAFLHLGATFGMLL